MKSEPPVATSDTRRRLSRRASDRGPAGSAGSLSNRYTGIREYGLCRRGCESVHVVHHGLGLDRCDLRRTFAPFVKECSIRYRGTKYLSNIVCRRVATTRSTCCMARHSGPHLWPGYPTTTPSSGRQLTGGLSSANAKRVQITSVPRRTKSSKPARGLVGEE